MADSKLSISRNEHGELVVPEGWELVDEDVRVGEDRTSWSKLWVRKKSTHEVRDGLAVLGTFFFAGAAFAVLTLWLFDKLK